MSIALAFSQSAAAQSFDCKLAKSPREHAVCSDEKLAALDSAVSDAYKSLRSQLSPESAALVQSDQREWLHWLDLVCPAHGRGIAESIDFCLRNGYTAREHDLERVTPIGKRVIFPRSRFLYKAGGTGEEQSFDNDPGFGYGSLSYPQIDVDPASPTTAYAEWNDAVKKAADRAVGFGPGDGPATFDAAVDASGRVDNYYSVEGANDRFLDVSLIVRTCSWGAAHPNTGQISFLWWLDRSREFKTSDVFLPHSGWQDKLTALTIANLRAQPELKDFLSDYASSAVQQSVPDPTTWTLTRDGLTITFGQGAIAAYVADMPEAQISWSDLKAYLASDLQPATLPISTAKPNP